MFENPFSFTGRIRRTEYGLSVIVYAILVNFIGAIAGTADLEVLNLLIIPLLWFYLAQGAKRCHDLGNSGWFQIIPFYGLWMLFAPGKEGPNRYGDDPKANARPTHSDILDDDLV